MNSNPKTSIYNQNYHFVYFIDYLFNYFRSSFPNLCTFSDIFSFQHAFVEVPQQLQNEAIWYNKIPKGVISQIQKTIGMSQQQTVAEAMSESNGNQANQGSMYEVLMRAVQSQLKERLAVRSANWWDLKIKTGVYWYFCYYIPLKRNIQ